MDGDDFADICCGDRACVSGGLDRTDISAYEDGDQARPDTLGSDQCDIGGLDHRISGFNGSNETSRFYHS